MSTVMQGILADADRAMYRDAYAESERLALEALRRSASAPPALTERALHRLSDAQRMLGRYRDSWVSSSRLIAAAIRGDNHTEHCLRVVPDAIECGIHLAFDDTDMNALIDDGLRLGELHDLLALRAATLLQKSRALRHKNQLPVALSTALAARMLHQYSSDNVGYSEAAHGQAVARCYLELGAVDEAEREYSEVLAKSRSNWSQLAAYIGLARVYLYRCQPRVAVDCAGRAVGLAHYLSPVAVIYALEVKFDAVVAQDGTVGVEIVKDLEYYTSRSDSVRRRYEFLRRMVRSSARSAEFLSEYQQLSAVLERT